MIAPAAAFSSAWRALQRRIREIISDFSGSP
jgi:hypothetical protein